MGEERKLEVAQAAEDVENCDKLQAEIKSPDFRLGQTFSKNRNKSVQYWLACLPRILFDL